jgi:hypothetical protein
MSRWMSKGRILTKFIALQVLIQGVTALSGFVIVRLLDKSQYAAYTIAASLQVLLTVLSDSGIGWGLNAIGGCIWKDDSARYVVDADRLSTIHTTEFGRWSPPV